MGARRPLVAALLVSAVAARLRGGAGFCTCPNVAVCTSADLHSSTGDEDCTVGLGGVLGAGISVGATSPNLERMDLDDIVTVDGDVTCEVTLRLEHVDLSSLQEIDGELRLVTNIALEIIALDALVSVTGGITAADNDALSELDLPVYTGGGGNIAVENNPMLVKLLLPSLVDAPGSIGVPLSPSEAGNPALTTIDLSSLATVAAALKIRSPLFPNESPMQQLDLGALTSVGGDLSLMYLRFVTALDLGELFSVGGSLVISGFDALVALELPALVTVAGMGVSGRSVWVEGGGVLESVDLSALTTAPGDVYFSPTTLTDLGSVSLNAFCTGANPGNVFIRTVAGGAGVKLGDTDQCASSAGESLEGAHEL